MTAAPESATEGGIFDYLLRLADDRLVLGHRLSEWCGHGPILEEDIALTNVALDLIGQATFIYGLAGQLEGNSRSADELAFLRDAIDFRNVQLVEQPNGDFAVTIARQFLFSAYSVEVMDALTKSSHEELAGIAAKAVKEERYHLRHAREWVLRLGDGTDESHRRMQTALDDIWMFTGELFESDELDQKMVADGVAPAIEPIRETWKSIVTATIDQATLTLPPDDQYMATGGRTGRHTEHLGHALDIMQILPRSHPGAEW